MMLGLPSLFLRTQTPDGFYLIALLPFLMAAKILKAKSVHLSRQVKSLREPLMKLQSEWLLIKNFSLISRQLNGEIKHCRAHLGSFGFLLRLEMLSNVETCLRHVFTCTIFALIWLVSTRFTMYTCQSGKAMQRKLKSGGILKICSSLTNGKMIVSLVFTHMQNTNSCA